MKAPLFLIPSKTLKTLKTLITLRRYSYFEENPRYVVGGCAAAQDDKHKIIKNKKNMLKI
jgi:hypothetical protein